MIQRQPVSQRCRSAGRVTARIFLSLLTASSINLVAGTWSGGWINGDNQIPMVQPGPSPSSEYESPISSPKSHDFTLRHIFHHGTHAYPNLHVRLDVRPDDKIGIIAQRVHERSQKNPLRAQSTQISIQRLSDRRVAAVQSLVSAARLSGYSATLAPSAWRTDEVMGPNVQDKETVITLALMAANSYILVPGTGEWEDVNGAFNFSDSFGWEGDGLRGHIFADNDNATVVIAIKGTTPAVFDGAETTSNDKENDNLFFGCCCGAGGHYLWRKVCECATSAFTCNQFCLVKALRMENRYYQAAIELYGNVTEIYPNSEIWLSGHSLGGAVSSLLGLTFGLPVTTYEAPGEALAAARLGLPSPPYAHPSAPQSRKNTGAYHFGHTADPIFMGTCNAATSGCTLGGYAMESQCHSGQVCIYDTVKDKGWRVGIGNHKIRNVIANVIRAYNEVATCVSDIECVDCFNWKYFESNDTEPIASSSSSSPTSTLTRTTTCHTPGMCPALLIQLLIANDCQGWWGCRDSDEPTTTSTTSQSSSTVTCSSYGWFGRCLDKPPIPVTSLITAEILTWTSSLTPLASNPAVVSPSPASQPNVATARTTPST